MELRTDTARGLRAVGLRVFETGAMMKTLGYVLFFAVIAVLAWGIAHLAAACDERGGVYVRAVVGFECVVRK
jgi:hypothetical protein